MYEANQESMHHREAKARFEHEALTSWTEYRKTGWHLTGEELREWLATWGTDDETPVPSSHK